MRKAISLFLATFSNPQEKQLTETYTADYVDGFCKYIYLR